MYMMLDPNKVTKENREEILKKFKPLTDRDMEEIPDEVKKEDRIAFDKAVLNAFDLDDIQGDIYNTLLGIFHIRNAVEVDRTIS